MKFSIRRINEWLILVMIVVLVPFGFEYVQNNWNPLPKAVDYLFNYHPTNIVIALGTIDAINLFGGDAVEGFSITWLTASIYFNIVLFLILGPYLFFKGFKQAKKNQENAKPWYWYVGGAICIGSLMIIPMEIKHLYSYSSGVYKSNMESVEKSRESDLMRRELTNVGFKAAEYEIVKDGFDESFEIGELDLEELKYVHSVENIYSDTLLVISVSNPEQPELGYQMEVRPYSESVLRFRN